MQINNGDRTFRDTDVQEFGGASLLTDVDGDGHAEELVIARSSCLPMRSGPETDPRFPSYGPYQQDVLEFCSTRPEGTLAVFKWNAARGTAEDISAKVLQRRRTRGVYEWLALALSSIASGDFDGDGLADLVGVSPLEILFFYSTDRETGKLPRHERGSASTALPLPKDCGTARSVRVVDLDLSGSQQVVVKCSTELHIYTQNKKRVWSRSPCEGQALGDVAQFAQSVPMMRNLSFTNCKGPKGRGILTWCQLRWGLRDDPPEPLMHTMSFLDFNRDGFPDMAIGDRSGPFYIYHNTPTAGILHNRFVAVKLVGTLSNEPGIGSTLILTASGMGNDGTSEVSQLREVSYGSASDPFGYLDDRTVFGLGPTGMPLRLEVRWPNRQVQVVDLWYLNTPEGAGQLSNAVSPIVITQPLQ